MKEILENKKKSSLISVSCLKDLFIFIIRETIRQSNVVLNNRLKIIFRNKYISKVIVSDKQLIKRKLRTGSFVSNNVIKSNLTIIGRIIFSLSPANIRFRMNLEHLQNSGCASVVDVSFNIKIMSALSFLFSLLKEREKKGSWSKDRISTGKLPDF